MNRKQRRACGIKESVKTYTLTVARIKKMKEGAAKEAVQMAFAASAPLIDFKVLKIDSVMNAD